MNLVQVTTKEPAQTISPLPPEGQEAGADVLQAPLQDALVDPLMGHGLDLSLMPPEVADSPLNEQMEPPREEAPEEQSERAAALQSRRQLDLARLAGFPVQLENLPQLEQESHADLSAMSFYLGDEGQLDALAEGAGDPYTVALERVDEMPSDDLHQEIAGAIGREQRGI